MMKSLNCLLLILVLAGAFSACSSKEVNENDPQAVFNDAEEDIKDKRYLVAADKLKSVKNKFPYSNLATQAKLRMGDVYFMEGSYVEAAGAYESFRDLHPKHEKADYVLFQIGESYFNQLPDTEDRDMTPATKAIEAYRELLGLYPQSQYIDKAKSQLAESNKKLSEKETYVADFYFKRDMFDSAATRYEKVATRYPGTPFEQIAYWKWGQSLLKQEKLDEAKHVYRVYISRFPDGKYTQEMGDFLDKNNGR